MLLQCTLQFVLINSVLDLYYLLQRPVNTLHYDSKKPSGQQGEYTKLQKSVENVSRNYSTQIPTPR